MKSAKKKKENPIIINASFEELVKESVSGNPAPESKEKISPEKKIKVLKIVHDHLVKKAQKDDNAINKPTYQDKVLAAMKLKSLVKKANEEAKKKKDK